MITFALPKDSVLQAAIGPIAIRDGQMDYVLRIKSLAGITVREALDAMHRTESAQLRERVHKLARQRLGERKPLSLVRSALDPISSSHGPARE